MTMDAANTPLLGETITDIAVRRARFALGQIAALDKKPHGAYGISLRSQHLANLAAFEPTISDYAAWLRDEIDLRSTYPEDKPGHGLVAAGIPDLRDRLRLVETLLDDIARHQTPEPSGVGPAITKETP